MAKEAVNESDFDKWQMACFAKKHSNCTANLSGTLSYPWSINRLGEIGALSITKLRNNTLLYAPGNGCEALRETICETEYKNILAAPAVITTAGAVEAIFCLYQAILSPGDKVICVTPSYEGLWRLALNRGAEVTFFPLTNEQGAWKLDLEGLLQLIDEKIKCVVINFPNNPTGFDLSSYELTMLIKHLDKQGCYLLSDEVFRGLSWSNAISPPAAALYEKAFSVTSVSKYLSLPGIRVGWIASKDTKTMNRVVEIKRYLSKCNDVLSESLVTNILHSKQCIIECNLKVINENWKILSGVLDRFSHIITAVKPLAGALCAVKISRSRDASKFIDFFAQNYQALLMPLNLMAFDDAYFRLGLGEAFKNNVLILEKGLQAFYTRDL